MIKVMPSGTEASQIFVASFKDTIVAYTDLVYKVHPE